MGPGPWPHGIWEVHMGNYYCMPHQLMQVLFSTPNPGYPDLSTLKMGYPILGCTDLGCTDLGCPDSGAP